MSTVFFAFAIAAAAVVPAMIILIAVKLARYKKAAESNDREHAFRGFAVPVYVAVAAAMVSVIFAILSFIFK